MVVDFARNDINWTFYGKTGTLIVELPFSKKDGKEYFNLCVHESRCIDIIALYVHPDTNEYDSSPVLSYDLENQRFNVSPLEAEMFLELFSKKKIRFKGKDFSYCLFIEKGEVDNLYVLTLFCNGEEILKIKEL